jgi:hypothetical protein
MQSPALHIDKLDPRDDSVSTSVGSDIRGGWGKDNGIVVGNDNCVILKFNPVKPRIINLRLSGRKLM